jgi:ABC-type amino acid transport substrate-binding protein
LAHDFAQPEYKSLKELKGKTLGMQRRTPTSRAHDAEAGRLDQKDIKVLALGSDAARLTALKRRVVDVVVISPPAGEEKQGLKFSPVPTSFSAFLISASVPT